MLGEDAHRLRAHEPAQQIHLMDAVRQGNPHPELRRPGPVTRGPPCPGLAHAHHMRRAAALVLPPEPDLADRALVERAADLDVAPGEAVAMADQQDDPGASAGLDHLVGLGQRAAHRLLAQHVLARLRRGHDLLGMHVFGGGDQDRVDVLAREHGAVVGIRVGAPRRRRRRRRLQIEIRGR